MVKEQEDLGNKRTSSDHVDYNIINIGQNTEKSSGDLRRLAVTQPPVKHHQITLLLKTLKRVKYDNNDKNLPGRNCVSFYRSGLISIWSIAYRYLSMPSLAACRCCFFLVDETLLPRSVNFSTSFREVPSSVAMSPVWLKHIYSVLCALIWRPMPAVARSKLCSSVLAWLGVFASIAMSSAYSASVIVFAGYLLLLFFVSSKPFSLILSIEVLIT